jgi:hypothetical protein
MEQRRKHEKTRIQNECRELSGYIKTNTSTLRRIKASESNTDFTRTQITKLSSQIEEYQEQIRELVNREGLLSNGMLDDYISNKYLEMRANSEKNKYDKDKKKELEMASNKIRKDVSQTFWDATVSSQRKDRYNLKDKIHSYKYFLKCCDSLPPHIRNNLRNMPNNKGYIWRGVYCYGEKPAEKGQPVVMFEKHKDNILIIHEWSKNEYRKYEKAGGNGKNGMTSNKRLIRQTTRSGKNINEDFIKSSTF